MGGNRGSAQRRIRWEKKKNRCAQHSWSGSSKRTCQLDDLGEGKNDKGDEEENKGEGGEAISNSVGMHGLERRTGPDERRLQQLTQTGRKHR